LGANFKNKDKPMTQKKPTIEKMFARLREIDIERELWPDEDTVPPDTDVIRSAGFVLDVCGELDCCPDGLGPIADPDGGIEICFISPSSGDYCNIVFKNTGSGHVSFTPNNGKACHVEHIRNDEMNHPLTTVTVLRFKLFLTPNTHDKQPLT
jgi:hypothetical protein